MQKYKKIQIQKDNNRWRALSGFTGRKGSVGGLLSEM